MSKHRPDVSATEPDWDRERPKGYWDPPRRLLRSIRSYQRLVGRSGPLVWLARKKSLLCYRFWSLVTQAEISLKADIGGGLMMPHPNGIVIHPSVVLGPNCLIFQQCTLGTVGHKSGAPHVGGHVDIGAGARILGPVQIGDHAKIGANAVVVKDVPAGAVASGVPAQIRLKD